MSGLCTSGVEHEEPRGRVLRLLDVVGLGLGGPFGLGIFVLIGFVAHSVAGPSVALCVLVAAILALLAGVCYVELGTLYPDTRGSACYVFTYCATGELLAFLVGWNLVFEYIVGAAAASRGVRAALDSLLNGTLASSFLAAAPLHNPDIASPYVDFVALVLPLLAAGLLLLTARDFAAPKVIISMLSVAAVLFIVVVGAIQADGENWALRPEEAPPEARPGAGGFAPFGLMGVLRGAAVCMHSFVGVDHIAATGRRVKGATRAVPWALAIVLSTTFLGMLGVGVVLTLVTPYYELDVNAAVVTAFSSLADWPEAQWIVCVAAIVALLLTVVGGTAASARLLRSLAEDGLLWPHIGRERGCGGKTPLYATMVVAMVTGLFGAFFQEHQLASVLSIGIILAFVAVQVSLVLHRCGFEPGLHTGPRAGTMNVLRSLRPRLPGKQRQPTRATAVAARIAILVFSLSGAGLAAVALNGGESLQHGDSWSVVLIVVFAVLCVLGFVSLLAQPQTTSKNSFRVPLVPLLPCVGILSCKVLIVTLHNTETWIRFGSWTIVGLVVYVACRVWRRRELHSATVLVNGSSSRPSSVSQSGFSLEVEQRSASVVSRDTRGSETPAWIEKQPPNDTQQEQTKIEENHVNVKNSSPFDEIIVEELKSEDEIIVEELKPEITEETEIIAAVTGIPASARARPPPPPSDTEHVKSKNADEVFDAEKWNKIWNTSNDLSDDDSDASSKIDETVVQIHESSTEETEETVETVEPPPVKPVEESYSEVPITKVEVVIQLPDAVPTSEESTSDADSLNSENTHRPMSPLPPPMPSELHFTTPEMREKPSEDTFLDPPAPTLRASAPPTTSRPPAMLNLQEELKTTLRLRNQKQIEQIENTAINVSEGIEIFGGKRSRTTSLNKGDNDNSIKSAMKAGRFEDPQFVYKLNNILQGQVPRPSSEQWKKKTPSNFSRQKEVVLVDQDGVSDQKTPQSSELAARMQQMRGTLEQILAMSPRSSSRPSDASSDRSSVAPTPPRPPSRVHKSLDSLGPSSEVQIVSRN